MKLSGKIIVPVVAIAIAGAIGYISYRRITLLQPGLEAPKIGEKMPELPLRPIHPDQAPPVFPIPQTECLVLILRGYAGYVDAKCVQQVATLVNQTNEADRQRIVVVYPGADPGREFERFTVQLQRAGIDSSLVTMALDQELYAVGALDAYGDPALPCAWQVDASGQIVARAYGTARDRTAPLKLLREFLAK